MFQQKKEQENGLFTVSPQKARRTLEELGFSENNWPRIMNQKTIGSHETRALIQIAMGSESRCLEEVCQEMKEK